MCVPPFVVVRAGHDGAASGSVAVFAGLGLVAGVRLASCSALDHLGALALPACVSRTVALWASSPSLLLRRFPFAPLSFRDPLYHHHSSAVLPGISWGRYLKPRFLPAGGTDSDKCKAPGSPGGRKRGSRALQGQLITWPVGLEEPDAATLVLLDDGGKVLDHD